MKKRIIFLLLLVTAGWLVGSAEAAVIVGRISHVEGYLYRYMDVDNSWVETHQQSPAGSEDILATGLNSRAEIVFPNKLMLQLEENTDVEILELDDALGVLQLNSGLARLYNRSVAGMLAVETARGTVRIPPGSVIDVQADANTIVISGVRGEATFRSFLNGVESLEVISGSTSLEFRAESVVAGTGPASLDWDRWCAGREEAWSRNSRVHSEYLPDAMQGYAYEIEPHGSWSRIYYRGYNYWGWKPHHVAADWSPYTTGYWYEWQGSPVWIDRNPWGWATHHHGHWIHLQGAWMWTPYVHVSHAPGVTLVGLNIILGKTFRPHWHPGRVRWIARNDDYIGWFPLAPWETYYGYRMWGPGTVLVQGGSGFRPGIDLSHHRHINRAVIIPKQQLHIKGPVVVNKYNTVKIRNMQKTHIINNYKPVLTAERRRTEKNAPGVSARVRNEAKPKVLVKPGKTTVKTGVGVKHESPAKREAHIIRPRKIGVQKKSLQDSGPGSSRQIIAHKPRKLSGKAGESPGAKESQVKNVNPAPKASEPAGKRQANRERESRSAARGAAPRILETKTGRDNPGAGDLRQAAVQTGSSKKGVQKNATATGKRREREQEQAREETRKTKRAPDRNEARSGKAANKKVVSRGKKEDRQQSNRELLSAVLEKPRKR